MLVSQRRDPAGIALDVLDSLLEGCQVISFDFTYLYVNATVARQAGRRPEDLLGHTMQESFPGIEGTPMFIELRRCMTDRVHHLMENEFTFADGSSAWFELHFVPVPEGLCILSVDITERRRALAALGRLEDQLRHAQKMEAVGRLAGGVAHDFNNMLTIILSYASMAQQSLGDPESVRGDLGEIEKAALRAAELTRQLLTFSRRQVFAPKVLDLNEQLLAMESVLRRMVGVDVDFRLVTAPVLGRIRVDPTQLEQVVINLVANARDAMPDGGKLTIETGDVELDEGYARDHLGTEPGPHVLLAVSDTGVGMDRETRERLFEPFFTTKPAGRGTGLGLSIVFGIVQQAGGSIWVYSEPGRGTAFKLYFPRVAEPADEVSKPKELAPRGGAKETVLLVEDDEQLRRVATGILSRGGFTVLEAATPHDALRIADEGPTRIDVLVTDVVLPHMNGLKLAERIQRLRPGMKVLFMSGYAGDALVHRELLEEEFPFLEKPFTPRSLTEAIRKVLD